MRYQEVLQLLKKNPFQPLRFHFTNGETRDVRHPEFAFVEKSLIVLIEPNREEERLAEDIAMYSLIHIVKIEPIREEQPARESV